MPRLIDGRSAAARLHASYDHVIVGSGSAGTVLASRIAAAVSDPVLLLEAGPSDRHIFIRMPAALGMPPADDGSTGFINPNPCLLVSRVRQTGVTR